ncbi:hypothetical protein [Mameliella alba]|uniref:hypothetical protein n=1 Tax=Mameliella alba TaxID=561184 RepID=UPI001ADAC172
MLELAQPDHRFHVQYRLGDRACGLLSRGKGEQAIGWLVMVSKQVLRRLDALIRGRAQQVEAFRIDRRRAAGHHCLGQRGRMGQLRLEMDCVRKAFNNARNERF